MATTYGNKRLVVGAHYGWKDFLVQRISAVLMAVFTLVVLAALLFWQAWIGACSIWYDYGKPAGLRLALQAVTVVWLIGCAGWAIEVLWRL